MSWVDFLDHPLLNFNFWVDLCQWGLSFLCLLLCPSTGNFKKLTGVTYSKGNITDTRVSIPVEVVPDEIDVTSAHLIKFLSSEKSGPENRAMQERWFTEYPWLIYDHKREVFFCKVHIVSSCRYIPVGILPGYFTLFLVMLIMVPVDQLMFAAINVCTFAKQTSSLLLMFEDSFTLCPSLLHKNGYNILNNDPIFKIQRGHESWEQGLQICVCH